MLADFTWHFKTVALRNIIAGLCKNKNQIGPAALLFQFAVKYETLMRQTFKNPSWFIIKIILFNILTI